MVSTRITYTFDVMKSFETKFGFVDYHTQKFKSDRIVIQIESLLKLDCPDGFIDDTVPVYDLIVLDELESVLKQLNSEETFKDRARTTYEFMNQIIKSSIINGGKVISMDGDLGSRAMHFLNTWGNSTNIINTIKFNTFKMVITSRRNYYEKCIFEALENKRNIVIPTMSAGYANQIYKAITAKYPELKVALYTTTSGGEDKKKFKHVDEYWNNLNVLIYSPTISAGVSFDKQHL